MDKKQSTENSGFVQNVMMVFKAFCSTLGSGNNFIYDGSSAEGFADVSGSSTLTGDYTTGTLTGDNETYLAVITSASDYYPFGAQMPTRNINPGGYRFGFQGQERDDEIKGAGNSWNYKYRLHDPRLGRFFSVDPFYKDYPELTPYQFSSNQVVHAPEFEGLETSNDLNSRSPSTPEKAQAQVSAGAQLVGLILDWLKSFDTPAPAEKTDAPHHPSKPPNDPYDPGNIPAPVSDGESVTGGNQSVSGSEGDKENSDSTKFTYKTPWERNDKGPHEKTVPTESETEIDSADYHEHLKENGATDIKVEKK